MAGGVERYSKLGTHFQILVLFGLLLSISFAEEMKFKYSLIQTQCFSQNIGENINGKAFKVTSLTIAIIEITSQRPVITLSVTDPQSKQITALVHNFFLFSVLLSHLCRIGTPT